MHRATKRTSAVRLFTNQFNSRNCTAADILRALSAATAAFCDHGRTQVILPQTCLNRICGQRIPAHTLGYDFATVGEALTWPVLSCSTMEAKALIPILNVSDIASTVAWFEKWGWKKLWDWGTPPTFGAVGSGKEACIFLCEGAQGGRGRGANTTTFQQDGDEKADKGVWMSAWVDDVDEMHKQCVAAGLEITFPPTDMPWNVRESTFAILTATCFGLAGDSSEKIEPT
jgi:hypothetical protein